MLKYSVDIIEKLFMKQRLILILILLGGLVLLLSPMLDSYLALIPYNPVTHTFYGETHLWCKIIYYGVNVATFLLIIIPLILLVLSRTFKLSNKRIIQRMAIISYLSLAIGPGLIVNSLLKENWGRARPYQVIRDHHQFSLPWQPHFSSPKDNSMPSGHVSIGAFIGIPFIAARRRKVGIMLSAIGFTLVALVRWLQGGHYFSDICLAAIIVWLVTTIVFIVVDKVFPIKKVI